jgi:pyruvate dehydrogenase (quinone)
VTWEQRVLTGDPKFEASQNVPAFDYAAYARQLGLEGVSVDADEDVVAAWTQALAADKPVVIDARTDPDVPPLPPHIKTEQALNYLQSMLKGDPDRFATLRATVRQMFGTGSK